MKRIQKYSLQIAAAAALAVVLTLAAPRAVTAVAAALVNVTNTAASPAISQGVERLASQNVFLTSGTYIVPGTQLNLARMLADGTDSANFVVPSGQSLVVTTIDVLTQGGGYYRVYLVNGNSGAFRKFLGGPLAAGITQFQYSAGIVFPAGESVQVQNDGSNPGNVTITMHGYLTSN